MGTSRMVESVPPWPRHQALSRVADTDRVVDQARQVDETLAPSSRSAAGHWWLGSSNSAMNIGPIDCRVGQPVLAGPLAPATGAGCRPNHPASSRHPNDHPRLTGSVGLRAMYPTVSVAVATEASFGGNALAGSAGGTHLASPCAIDARRPVRGLFEHVDAQGLLQVQARTDVRCRVAGPADRTPTVDSRRLRLRHRIQLGSSSGTPRRHR